LPVSALTAPIRVLLAMFSRWPLYLSHDPVNCHRPNVSQNYTPFRRVVFIAPHAHTRGTHRQRRCGRSCTCPEP
jgi:hypothetical protein